MITPLGLNEIAKNTYDLIKKEVRVTIDGTIQTFPFATNAVNENTISIAVILPPEVYGTITRIEVPHISGNPFIVEPERVTKQAGRLFVITFRLYIEQKNN